MKDALDKRNIRFSEIKNSSSTERKNFYKEVIIISVKRAKLISSVDKIVVECDKKYETWEKSFGEY